MDDRWSEIPLDLLENIASRLDDYVDYVRLRAVCVKWRSSLPPKPQYLINQFPWLMLSPEPDLPYGERHGFYNLLENKLYHFNMPVDRPCRRCCGSSHGWLVFVEERGPAILLFNPITSVQVQLPPITAFPNVLGFNIRNVGEEYVLHSPFGCGPMKWSLNDMRDIFVKKVVLSANPTSLIEDYVAVAIIGITMQLAFYKKGDEKWTLIDNSMYYEDVIFCQGIFYAVHHSGSIAIFDVSGPSPSKRVIQLQLPLYCHDPHKYYLVDSFGELLMVNRLFDCVRDIDHKYMVYETIGFEVVRLNSSFSRRPEWVKMESLGDIMLFLGTSSSLCLLVSDFSGCDGTCIYFTGESNKVDNHSYCNHDSGVFSLKDGSIKGLLNCTSDGTSFLPPPVWLTPNPCSVGVFEVRNRGAAVS